MCWLSSHQNRFISECQSYDKTFPFLHGAGCPVVGKCSPTAIFNTCHHSELTVELTLPCGSSGNCGVNVNDWNFPNVEDGVCDPDCYYADCEFDGRDCGLSA